MHATPDEQRRADTIEATLRHNDNLRAHGADIPGRLSPIEWQRLAAEGLDLARLGIEPIEENVQRLLAVYEHRQAELQGQRTLP